MRGSSPIRCAAAFAVLLAMLALGACRAEHPAIVAFAYGRFGEALAGFRQLERDLGDEAPAAVFHGQALSALRTGALVEAELAVEKLVARGGLDFAPERDFVLGVTAFVRCERAEAQASGPEAEPFAFDVAIAHAEAAQAAWQRAAIARGDWPEARRNLVRAMNKLDELRKKRQAAIERKRKDQRPDSKPKPSEEEAPRDSDGQPKEIEPAPRLEPQAVELARGQIDGLLRRLDEKEREKGALRRSQRTALQSGVEKDW